MKLRSIKFEISILLTGIVGIILIVFSSVLYFISTSSFKKADQQLQSKAQAVGVAINSYWDALDHSPESLPKAVRKVFAIKNEGLFPTKLKKASEEWVNQAQSLNLSKDYMNFFSKDGKELISSANFDKSLQELFMENLQLPKGLDTSYKTLTYNHKNIRIISYPFKTGATQEYFIQIGVSQDPMMEQLHNWLFSILISLPLILFLTSLTGRMQARRILEPVYEITQMANKITHQDLSVRIKARYFDKEMSSLIDSFNDMIARLEKSFKHIEEFSHHVAHELKTPLTIIKGEMDLSLRKERSKHEYQQALQIVLEESERVLKTIDDLLLLAKLDYQPDVFKFEQFDFIEFFNEICEQARILAAKRGVSIMVQVQKLKSGLIKADRLHLRRLFFNIVDNAIKFTPDSGRIDIKVLSHQGQIVTAITDYGPGLAAENLSRIFEKFFRTNHNVSGSGLGLNIAHTIAKLHQGEILVESKPGQGSTFKIILPCF